MSSANRNDLPGETEGGGAGEGGTGGGGSGESGLQQGEGSARAGSAEAQGGGSAPSREAEAQQQGEGGGRKKPMVVIVVGMAGSGKTTLMQRLYAHMHGSKIAHYLINLDPAVPSVPYLANIDIRDTVNYKNVMKEYGLGPNGAILTSLNLFTTKIDEVIKLVERRADLLDYVFIDTPGQIEIFTWSASGAIITEAFASTFPTAVCFVVDTPRAANPGTFISSMLYACGILYKTQLPLLLAFNKTDVARHDFAVEWMRDFEAFQAAVDRDPSYAASLSRSLCLALEEFYCNLHAVGVSAVTGGGINEFFTAGEAARKEYMEGYRVDLEKMRAEKEKKEAERQSAEMARFRADSAGESDALARRTGKMKLDDDGEGSAIPRIANSDHQPSARHRPIPDSIFRSPARSRSAHPANCASRTRVPPCANCLPPRPAFPAALPVTRAVLTILPLRFLEYEAAILSLSNQMIIVLPIRSACLSSRFQPRVAATYPPSAAAAIPKRDRLSVQPFRPSFRPSPLIMGPVTSRLITPSASCSVSSFSIRSISNLSRILDGATISSYSLKPSLTSSASTPIPSSALSPAFSPGLSPALSSFLSGRRSFGSKIKVKPYSSLKRRFKLLANGDYKRWRAGKRHNASTKTKKQRRQLRQPSVVPPGLKQPMRYLGFKR
ncbi:unnamed protein product [Closterium sp. Yama58-4]|nr:unnamed protein product [Closterium sp. Yama58-4]